MMKYSSENSILLRGFMMEKLLFTSAEQKLKNNSLQQNNNLWDLR